MSDDEDARVDALLAHLRAKDGLSDPQWDALARGELSEEEQAALRERPPRPGSAEPPYELFRPLDEEERSALAEGVFAALDAQKEKEPPPAPAPAPVVPIEKARPRRTLGIAAALVAATLAAAAAVAIVRRPAPAPLAAYTLAVEGGNKEQRGDSRTVEGALRLDPDTRFALALRPEKPVTGAIAVRAFLVRDGAARPWEAPAMLGAGGTVRIEGTAAALFGDVPEGAWEVVILLGRPEVLPDENALARGAVTGEGLSGLSVHRVPIILTRPRGALGGGGEEDSRIVFSGCEAVLAGGRCALGEARALRFFVPHVAPEAVVVKVDGAPLAARGESLQRGARLSVQVPAGTHAITVSVEAPGDARTRALSLAAPVVLPDSITQAEAARRQGDLVKAETLADAALHGADPAAQRAARRTKARILAARGAFAEAKDLFREAITEGRQAGRISEALDDMFALAYGLTLQTRAFAEARALLDEARSLGEQCPEALPKAAYYLGLVALETGDLRAAVAHFRAAAEGAERLGLDDYRSAVLEQEAEALAVLGRHEEAAARRREAGALLGEAADACRRAQHENNLGWGALRAALATGEGVERAMEPLEAALARTRAGCPAGLSNVALNLALAETERGHAAAARGYLNEARRAGGGWASLAGWERMVEARVLAAEGATKEALAASKALESEGERLLLPELVVAGALGQAEALADSADHRAEARAAYARAERALAAWGRGMPLGEGRGTFFMEHRRLARLEMDFLVREALLPGSSATRDAVDSARRLLGLFHTALRHVDRVGALPEEARRRWEEAVAEYRRERALLEERAAAAVPGASNLEAERTSLRASLDRAIAALGTDVTEAAPLRAPDPGEVLLVYHPIRQGWAGFALSDEGQTVTVHKLAAADPGAAPAALAEQFLHPFRDVLAKTRRARLILPAELLAIDWHALPLDGAPLIERMEVVYGLDLQTPGDSVEGAGATAVLVADPTEDLPGARASAEDVARALEARGLRVLRLVGAAATHAAVRDAIEQPGTKIFHYAGHASFEGPDGLEASLRLSRRERLSLADVMALRRVPEIVVLAGCETARAGEGSAAGSGLGLGQAFLLKGARAALATPRPVGDALAERAVRLLYANGVEADPAAALRAAAPSLRAEAKGEDWSVLRALVR